MNTEPKNDDAGAETDRDQALWELLGKARPVRVSPYFVRRVLRDLDAGAATGRDFAAGWRAWLRPAWIVAAGAAVLAGVIGVASIPPLPITPRAAVVAKRQQLPPERVAVAPAPEVLTAQAAPVASASGAAKGAELASGVSAQDVDIIADLDNLVAREETSVWTDDTSRF